MVHENHKGGTGVVLFSQCHEFLNDPRIRFANYRKVQDSKMKELVRAGVGTTVKRVGTTVKQVEVILPEHEEKTVGNRSIRRSFCRIVPVLMKEK